MSQTFYNIIKHRLFAAEDTNVPAGMWANIAKEIPSYQKRRQYRYGWLWFGGFLAIGIVAYLVFPFAGNSPVEQPALEQSAMASASSISSQLTVIDPEVAHPVIAKSSTNEPVKNQTAEGTLAANHFKENEAEIEKMSANVTKPQTEVIVSHENGDSGKNAIQNEGKTSEKQKLENLPNQLEEANVTSALEQDQLAQSDLATNNQQLVEIEAQITKIEQRFPAMKVPAGIFPMLIRKAYDQKPLNQLLANEHIQMDADPECYKFDNRSQSNFSVDVYAGPSYSLRPFKSRNEDVSGYILAREETETFQYTFQAGARINLMLNNGLSARTGFHFTQVGERFDYTNPNDTRTITRTISDTIRDGSGNILSINQQQITEVVLGETIKKIFNRYKSLDIPVLLGYELPVGKMNVGFSLGPVFNISSWQRGQFLDPALAPKHIDLEQPIQYFPAYKTTLGIGGYLGAYITYPIGDKTALFVEPHALHRFQSITFDNYAIDQRHTQIGLNVGLRFKL